MWVKFNPNPNNRITGDCVIRAICKALNQSWQQTYMDLAIEGFRLCDMPNANHVWGAYLKSKGFGRDILPNSCPDCYTVLDFCKDHPWGTFVLALNGHVIAVKDSHYYDSWDSGSEVPLYYWSKIEGDVK